MFQKVQYKFNPHLCRTVLCAEYWRGVSSSLGPQHSDILCPAGPETDEAHTPAPPLLENKYTNIKESDYGTLV